MHWAFDKWSAPELIATAEAQADPTALAQEIVNQKADKLADEMVNKLCGQESSEMSVAEGDLFITFDPSKSMYNKCITIGGKMPVDCLSAGECQLKIGTVKHYYPQLYGKTITTTDALLLANNPTQARTFTKDCAIKIDGCIWNWTTANDDPTYYETIIPIIRQITN
jgi:hypothetical protein